MSVLVVAGTRPEIIKLAPVYAELRRRRVNAAWVFTGQQPDLGPSAFKPFNMSPEVIVTLNRRTGTLAELSVLLADHMNEVYKTTKPDLVLVQGDTLSAAVAAQQAFLSGIQTGHVEAGLRSYNTYSPYPEEACRIWIDAIADLKFAPTGNAAMTLSGKVWTTGNTVIDALKMIKKARPRKGSYAVVTMHRRENANDVIAVAQAIRTLAENRVFDYIVWPVHPNPAVADVVPVVMGGVPNVECVAPLPYDEMVNLVRGARVLFTDSGGLQEEALALDVPCLIMRKETERPEGVAAGGAHLVGCDPAKIIGWGTFLMMNDDEWSQMAQAKNPYGDGKAARRIAAICKAHLEGRPITDEYANWKGVTV